VPTDLTLLTSVSFRGREVTSPRIGGLLALLADELRTGCSTALLVEGLWPDRLPENPTKAVQILVSRARALLGAEVIVSTPSGYRLGLGEEQVDAAAALVAVAEAARAARGGDHLGALERAEAGLALWAGRPQADPEPGDPLALLRQQRTATYRRLAKARALALAGLGRYAEAYEALGTLVRENPGDEEVLVALLRAEAATQGPSKALTRYDAYRRELRGELGTEPGAALEAVYQELLQNEAPPVRRGLAHDPNPLLGREEDIAAVVELTRTSRVASIVGAGGLGKTRLAHVVAWRAEHRVVHFVELAGVGTDDGVAAEVAAAVGAQAAGPVGLPGPVDDADRAADRVGLADGVVAQHARRAAVGGVQRGEDLDGGGLAGAVRAQQREDRSRRDLEVDAVEDDLLAVGLAEAGDLDRGSGCRGVHGTENAAPGFHRGISSASAVSARFQQGPLGVLSRP